jgi:hypothetical protein
MLQTSIGLQVLQQLAKGLPSMRDNVLFARGELSKGLGQRWVIEVRIIAKPSGATRLFHNHAINPALRHGEHPRGARKCNHADVVRASALGANRSKLANEPGVVCGVEA